MPVVRDENSSGARLPDLVQQDLGGAFTYPLYSGADLVVPSSGTATLYDPSKREITTGAVAVVGDIPQLPVTSSELSGTTRSMDWEIRWSLLYGAVTRTFRQRVGIVKFAPPCPVSHGDLIRRRPRLTIFLQGTGRDDFQDPINDAWEQVQRWLARKGNRHHLVMDISELYDLTYAWTMKEIYREAKDTSDQDGSLHSAYRDWVEELRGLKDETSLTYDTSDDGIADDLRRSAAGPVYLAPYAAMRLP